MASSRGAMVTVGQVSSVLLLVHNSTAHTQILVPTSTYFCCAAVSVFESRPAPACMLLPLLLLKAVSAEVVDPDAGRSTTP